MLLSAMRAMTALGYANQLFKLNLQILKNLRLQNLGQECVNPAPKKVNRRLKGSKDVEQYMNSNEHLQRVKEEIPLRFLKTTRKAPDDLYLVDSDIAKDIAAAVQPHILTHKNTIIETNPGFGFLTKEILEAGVKNMQLYESTVCFRNHILNLDKQYPGKLQLYNRDFFSIWKLSYQDRHDNGDRVKRMLSNVEIKQWDQSPAMTIIGTTSSTNFLRHLLLSLIFQFGIMTYGRCELYLILPPYLYLQLTSSPEDGYLIYRASAVLFQFFCDHEILLKLPRKAFLPWDNVMNNLKKSKLWKTYRIDPEYMYLTRIEFKKDLPVPMDKLQQLWYFAQHMMLSRNRRIIPSLEKWIPGCGLRLILSNSSKVSQPVDKSVYPDINIYTQTGQMNAQQLLNLFKEFSSWPEYSESPFIASMETALLKMESIENMEVQTEVPEERKDSESIPQSKNIVDET